MMTWIPFLMVLLALGREVYSTHCTVELEEYKFEVEDACYEVTTWSATWDKAEEYCISRGGHLADINSTEEMAEIKSYIPIFDEHLWIGLNRTSGGGNWMWSSGVQLSYSLLTQPDASSSANNCALLEIMEKGFAGWHAHNCHDTNRLICKYTN